ncbi:hypothetical protein C3L33_19506, partial [Rhododendron williamsianum]
MHVGVILFYGVLFPQRLASLLENGPKRHRLKVVHSCNAYTSPIASLGQGNHAKGVLSISRKRGKERTEPMEPFPCPSDVNVADSVTLKLSPTNYFAWKNLMLAFFKSRSLSGFVDGTLHPPSKPSPLAESLVLEEKRREEEEERRELMRRDEWDQKHTQQRDWENEPEQERLGEFVREQERVREWEQERPEGEWEREQEQERQENWKREWGEEWKSREEQERQQEWDRERERRRQWDGSGSVGRSGSRSVGRRSVCTRGGRDRTV